MKTVWRRSQHGPLRCSILHLSMSRHVPHKRPIIEIWPNLNSSKLFVVHEVGGNEKPSIMARCELAKREL